MVTRPMEGAPDHQHRDDRHGSSWSGGLGCALADTPHSGERGSPPAGESRARESAYVRAQARDAAEGRRRVVTGASEDGDSVDVAGRERPPRKDEETRTDTSEVRGAP